MYNERYDVVIDKLSSFKQIHHENVEAMYSGLNVLVNEIIALGVNNIKDAKLNRKILHSLRKLDYDFVKAILFENKLYELTPNSILNKITTFEKWTSQRCHMKRSSRNHFQLKALLFQDDKKRS
jgi:hypothetical protein